MRTWKVAGLVGVLVLGVVPIVSAAGVPCAGTSEVVAVAGGGPGGCVPDIAIECPAGDTWSAGWITVTATVRDCYGSPLAGLPVTLSPVDWRDRFCMPSADTLWTGMTNGDGQVLNNYFRWGGYGFMWFRAVCEGVELGNPQGVEVRSYDINRSCQVDAVDFAIFGPYFGGPYPDVDYNCDGVVNAIDFAMFAEHFGDRLP